MELRYLRFCMTNSVFYDLPDRPETAGRRDFFGFPLPEGWSSQKNTMWTMVSPPGARLPDQGWKIHVSTTLANAAHVLAVVREHCFARGISFKFLTDQTTLLVQNAKYADRGASGKFITVYPADPAVLEKALGELGEELAAFPGPYILSDARWGAGPLHIRYGGFTERFCKVPGGELVHAVEDPDGTLVPDPRRPEFTVPPWVEVPDFLAGCVRAREVPDTPHELPYRIEHPLHFSNGGGVYLATDERTGRRVVLKEARPLAGVDQTGADAVARLHRERRLLEQLAHTGVVPEVLDHLVVWEHHFLVEEYVEGQTLGRLAVRRNPLINPEPSLDDVAEFTRWALEVLDRVERGLRVMHDAGVVFGDLHPHNVVVRPDGRVVFLDLEVGSEVADRAPPVLAAPGYCAPDGRVGADADLYAMACLKVGLFLPLTIVLPLHPAKAVELAEAVARRFPVPDSFAADVSQVLRDRRPRSADARLADAPAVTALTCRVEAGEVDWPALRRSLRDAILRSATPERPDRLFPGDIEQFASHGLGFAHGAAGVLYALARSGEGRFPEHERWLCDAVRHGHHKGHVGFYNGLHGIAHVLAELGRSDDAFAVLDRALAVPLDGLPHSLFAGLAGVGLNLLHFADLTGDPSLTALAIEAGGRLAEHFDPDKDADAGTRAGLMYGASGQAALLIALHRATGDTGFLDAAETALRRDVDRCVLAADGTRQLDEGWRVMPYLATGSVGVGLVLEQFLREREHPVFGGALAEIRRAAEPEFVICSGLFNGRAGFIDFLAGNADDVAGGKTAAVVARHVRRLAWHMLPYQDRVAFPGDQLMRLSMDLATGSAGVLAALGSAIGGTGRVLPFFEHVPRTTAPGTPGRALTGKVMP